MKAPIVFSFKTASSVTGQRYGAAVGSTSVRFVVKDKTKLEVYYSDYEYTEIPGTEVLTECIASFLDRS